MARTRRRALVRGHGHPRIRATHAKTLEFTHDNEVTERATCVVGVAAELDPTELGLLRGRVRFTVEAAGHEATGEATINPDHAVRDGLVLRRSHHTDSGTLAVAATLTAEDLDRDLAAALTDPATAVTLTLVEVTPPTPLILLRQAGQSVPVGRLDLLWRHADETVDLVGSREPVAAGAVLDRAGIVAVTLPPAGEGPSGTALAWLSAAAGAGARFALLGGAGGPTEVLFAAGLSPTPALLLGRVDRRAVRRPEVEVSLRSALAPTVLVVPADEVDAVLEHVVAATPARRVAVPDGRPDVGTAMRWTTAERAGAAVRRVGVPEVTIVLASSPATDEPVDLDALVRALASAGVSPRTLSEALAPFGLNRRRVYDALGPDRSAGGPAEPGVRT
ncbi:DUF371 domain-containing protein [Micromonospora sp. NBC_01796]|uniref:DUF371 domain-containing protein n=1 Tax=Micromonospora sp. NBC_01796 TaxID=2975987 RepID=UPI002DD8A9D6|nr:DUF371 domain-containing protein [Micromonospora sp. NBC_01796]WSA87947.1 DUF371 domain-containing protein [Micromonospora sp. NBC_01796]